MTSTNHTPLISAISSYWDEHIHDLTIATHPIGTVEFFRELAEYRFDKLRYLTQVVNFTAYKNLRLLEVGCGVGLDLARFARAGAQVTGVDLSPMAVRLAQQNFKQQGLTADLCVMNGEALQLASNSFNVVYAHGVLPYTADPQQMINELHRVLRPGGQAILMVYNTYSWLMFLSKLMKVELEHEDAPVIRTFSIKAFKQMLRPFAHVQIIPERFPVPTRLHHGLKATLYNNFFVSTFNTLPRSWVRPFGWHLMAFAHKSAPT
jgi:2-polyprenyl-3-methyl-5-hydroxy-6-metoxy-1,4-benzoquinol methylase